MSFVTLSNFITPEDIISEWHTSTDGLDTPVLRLIERAKAKGYNSICLPLTTAKWKHRWTEMCLILGDSDAKDGGEKAMGAEERAEAWRVRPAFLRDEVAITRLGV
jgi:protein arginine N-methyltransferase 5